MFLSKRSNGIYYLWFTADGGKKQKVSTGAKYKSDALRFLRDFNNGEKKRREKIEHKNLTDFFSEYREYSKGIHTLKTQQSIDVAFRELIRIMGDVPISKIGIREIERFLAQKKVEASDWTARKYFIHLASAFETAKRWNYLETNPFRSVQKPKMKEVQPSYFLKEEVTSMLALMEDENLKNLYLLAVSTGLRLGEIINLMWCDIDLNFKLIHVRNSESFTTKSRKNRSIPLNEQIYTRLIDMRQNSESELVFNRNGKKLQPEKVSKIFKEYIRKAGLNDKLHFHSLRHTFASWLVQDGVSLYEVQKLLGHSNISVTQVYSHLQPEKLHATVNRISIPLN